MSIALTDLHQRHPLLALGLAACTVLAGGCSREQAPEGPAPVRPVKTMVVEPPDLGSERKFPGRVDAERKAELAFRVPGTVQTVEVKEGDQVQAGQVLITLDPTDYQIALKDAQATFDQAESDYERAQELVAQDFISRTDFDAKEAAWKTAGAALQRAKQDLAYTKLQASFDGVISQRYAERYEEVQAKQAVLAMQDNQSLQVKVDIPEAVVLSVRPSDSGRPEPGRIPVTASFDNKPGQTFDLVLREISTRADPATQTFEATFSMPAPKDFMVFPGMTATVTADLSGVSPEDTPFILPASAVAADAEMAPFVWVVDEPDMTVRKVPVEAGRLRGSSIEVAADLEPGSRVVVAGVGYLAEGMAVRLLAAREEAEPRADEAPNALDLAGGRPAPASEPAPEPDAAGPESAPKE
jgi:RND family efflux transporter MFP subunit